jgi:hypothetical protein
MAECMPARQGLLIKACASQSLKKYGIFSNSRAHGTYPKTITLTAC